MQSPQMLHPLLQTLQCCCLVLLVVYPSCQHFNDSTLDIPRMWISSSKSRSDEAAAVGVLTTRIGWTALAVWPVLVDTPRLSPSLLYVWSLSTTAFPSRCLNQVALKVPNPNLRHCHDMMCHLCHRQIWACQPVAIIVTTMIVVSSNIIVVVIVIIIKQIRLHVLCAPFSTRFVLLTWLWLLFPRVCSTYTLLLCNFANI